MLELVANNITVSTVGSLSYYAAMVSFASSLSILGSNSALEIDSNAISITGFSQPSVLLVGSTFDGSDGSSISISHNQSDLTTTLGYVTIVSLMNISKLSVPHNTMNVLIFRLNDRITITDASELVRSDNTLNWSATRVSSFIFCGSTDSINESNLVQLSSNNITSALSLAITGHISFLWITLIDSLALQGGSAVVFVDNCASVPGRSSLGCYNVNLLYTSPDKMMTIEDSTVAISRNVIHVTSTPLTLHNRPIVSVPLLGKCALDTHS